MELRNPRGSTIVRSVFCKWETGSDVERCARKRKGAKPKTRKADPETRLPQISGGKLSLEGFYQQKMFDSECLESGQNKQLGDSVLRPEMARSAAFLQRGVVGSETAGYWFIQLCSNPPNCGNSGSAAPVNYCHSASRGAHSPAPRLKVTELMLRCQAQNWGPALGSHSHHTRRSAQCTHRTFTHSVHSGGQLGFPSLSALLWW